MDVLVTGSSSGFGELIVKTLASDGHDVFASMRNVGSTNAPAAQRLHTWARENGVHVEVLDLDVTRDESVTSAVSHIELSLIHI